MTSVEQPYGVAHVGCGPGLGNPSLDNLSLDNLSLGNLVKGLAESAGTC